MNGDALRWLARAIRVPNKDDDPTGFRIVIVAVLASIIAVVGTHLAAAKGFFERFGVSRVAYASELTQTKRVSVAILRRLVRPEIRAKVRARCEADTAEARERVNRDIDILLREFQLEAGEPFGDLPTCDEV